MESEEKKKTIPDIINDMRYGDYPGHDVMQMLANQLQEAWNDAKESILMEHCVKLVATLKRLSDPKIFVSMADYRRIARAVLNNDTAFINTQWKECVNLALDYYKQGAEWSIEHLYETNWVQGEEPVFDNKENAISHLEYLYKKYPDHHYRLVKRYKTEWKPEVLHQEN